MLRISSSPLSLSFTPSLPFLTPPPPSWVSHPLPTCLSLILPLSSHFTILFLSPSRCFKAHITHFSLSISPLFFFSISSLTHSLLPDCLHVWSFVNSELNTGSPQSSSHILTGAAPPKKGSIHLKITESNLYYHTRVRIRKGLNTVVFFFGDATLKYFIELNKK